MTEKIKTPATTRILIVDDHPLMRMALWETLKLDPDLTVVGEAADGFQAVEMTQSLQPELVLMDIQLPGMDGVEATRKILSQVPGTRVILITSSHQNEKVLEAVRAGASGYLLKDMTPKVILNSIRKVKDGLPAMASEVSEKLTEALQQEAARPVLTSREEELLMLIGQGINNKQIAQMLGLSAGTVRVHVQNIRRKLGLEDRSQMAIYAEKKWGE